ncbi:MAG: hemerythrin domain-containing protein, partial [Moheibacter sp.]
QQGDQTFEQILDKSVAEHQSVGDAVDRIRELADEFTLPEDACASYTLLYKMLDDFENDLHTHIHLENNILFPKAAEMEKQLV